VSKGEAHRVKNVDKIAESHKPQLKLEHKVYLLSYTIKIKKNLTKLLKFWVFKT